MKGIYAKEMGKIYYDVNWADRTIFVWGFIWGAHMLATSTHDLITFIQGMP